MSTLGPLQHKIDAKLIFDQNFPPANLVGAPYPTILQFYRQARHLGYKSVAVALNVKIETVIAVERGDIHDFNSYGHALAFVRSYATFLKIPADRVAAIFQEQEPGQDFITTAPLWAFDLTKGFALRPPLFLCFLCLLALTLLSLL